MHPPPNPFMFDPLSSWPSYLDPKYAHGSNAAQIETPERERERERWLPSVTFGQSKSCVQCKGASKVCGARKDDGHKTTLYFIVMYCNCVAMMGRTAPSTATASKSICSTNS